MRLQPDDISKVIAIELEKFKKELDVKEVGYVLQVGDGIARIYGLSGVMAGELLKFASSPNVYGMALNLEESNIGAILFGEVQEIKEGDEVLSTGHLMQVPVSDAVLGRIIDPLGRPIDGHGVIKAKEFRPVENEAPAMFNRARVRIPLETGIKAIDGMIPIGKGQRELIIGDRHTGKTSIAIDTIVNQKGKDVICVYAAIGQKQSDVAKIFEKLKSEDAISYTTIVAANAADSSSSQFIAPYAGCAVAEYFMDQGKHVLIVYDDLSKHAVAYREISLLLRRPPGREAYPGDVFYIHSRLLERAAMMNSENGGGSITALPIVETQSGDVSAYIPTNTISITDGQIYLESHLFNSGIRPAINAGLSVSRVGGDAQIKAMKQVAAQLKIDLAQYREISSFSQFGTEMDSATTAQLERGKRVAATLQQGRFDARSTAEQICLFYAAKKGLLDSLKVTAVPEFEQALLNDLRSKNKSLQDKIMKSSSLDDHLATEIEKVLKDLLKGF